MKITKFLFVFVLLLFFNQVKAQVSITLQVDSHPTPRISDWVNRDELAILEVTNSDPQLEGNPYIIKVEMYLDGDMVLETDNSVPQRNIILGTETFLADEVIPYNAIQFHNNSFRNHVLQTGLLPGGEYQFCVRLLDLDGNIISTPTGICLPMIITEYQRPELINPIDNDTIHSQLVPTINFQWTPMSPLPPAEEGVQYNLVVKEVQDGQSPSQAFQVNYAIFEEDVDGGAVSFPWPTDLDAPSETTQYVWSVKPITSDSEAMPYFTGSNGFVPYETFVITPADDIEIDACDCSDQPNTEPDDLVITQPEPLLHPRKLVISDVLAFKSYLINCNNDLSTITHQVNVEIEWDDDHTDSITNNGPFEHEYAETDEIPSEVCVHYSIEPKPGYNGGQCEKTFCATVPTSVLNTNVGNIPTGNIVANDTIYAGHNGEFAVVTDSLSVNNNKYSGKGSVFINFLQARMAVRFEGITVDTDKKLLTGAIVADVYDAPAPQYPKDWALEVVANNPTVNNVTNNVANWGNQQVNNVIDWTNSTSGKVVNWVNNTTGTNVNTPTIDPNNPIPNGPLNENTDPVKVPLGVNMPNNDQLAITEMIFLHDKSQFNLVAAKNTPPSWGNPIQLVGFEAHHVQFHPTHIVTPPERIDLVEDVSVGSLSNKFTFTFKAPDSNNSGCYIEWNENGFSEFGVEIESSFDRMVLIPSPDDGTSRSHATLSAVGTSWNDMILTGMLEKSIIPDSNGMTIKADSISYDMSDVMNPTSISFPQNYNGETTNLFRGFFMKNLTLEMPDTWQSASNPVEAVIHDMIVDDTGLTLFAEVNNIAQFPNANVADLAASIDSLKVNIISNSFVNASLKGRIALPVSKTDSVQNPLQYIALYQTGTTASDPDYFQLTIEPTGPIHAHLLKGDMNIDPTSNIIAYVDRMKRTFQSTLNGNFVWDDVTLGPAKHVNFDINFQGLEMNYNSTYANNKFQFNAGSWSFASPQKFLANFPVTIDNIEFNEMPASGNQLLHGKLNFDVIFNLSQDIGGQSTMGVEVGVDENAGGSGAGKFSPHYIGTSVDDISVYAHLSAVTVDGSLSLRNNDPVYGNGFKGTLSAVFKTPQVSIDALAEFGNTSYQYNSTYRYWRVEAAAKFIPGIPFLPGVAFYGFGGGAYNNMESSLVPASGNTPASYTFAPHKGNLGFKVLATVGSTPKVESFNADVGLNGQFSSSQGLINIGFTGDFYVGAPLMPPSKRNDAQIKGSLLADYNFPDKHFYFNSSVDVNKPSAVVANNQSIVLDINGKTNKWYFKFGEPDNVNAATIFGLNLYEYLMFGNDVHAPANGFTQDFIQRYQSHIGHTPGIPGGTGVDGNSATGRGFALGLGVKFDKDVEKNIISGYKVHASLAAGAEVNLSMMEYSGYNCANPSQRIGFNGWRARGSLGFYVNGAASVTKNSNSWNIASVKVGGWVDAKFPRPTYVTGAVDGDVKIGHFTTKIHTLGDCSICHHAYHFGRKENGTDMHWGSHTSCVHLQDHYLLNTTFHKDFEWAPNGNYCGKNDNNSSPDAGPAAVQQDAAADQEQNLIKYIHPGMQYNFPTTMPIAVKYGLPLNTPFDVTEQQSDGSVITRTFKLMRTINFQEKDPNNSSFNMALSVESSNTVGEYLYVLGQVQHTQISANAPVFPSNNTNQNNNAGAQNQPVQQMGRATLTNFPPPPPPSEYDNLPPETPPVVNTLQENVTYRLTVTATLKEYKNNQWVNALKSDNSIVRQTVTKTFRTGPMQIITVSASRNSSNPGGAGGVRTPQRATPPPTTQPVRRNR